MKGSAFRTKTEPQGNLRILAEFLLRQDHFDFAHLQLLLLTGESDTQLDFRDHVLRRFARADRHPDDGLSLADPFCDLLPSGGT